MWRYSPETGRDNFEVCASCHGGEPTADAEVERRMNGCPLLPREEWLVAEDRGTACADVVDTGDVCPGAYARSAAALEAERDLLWWEKSQLELLYPGGVPVTVVEAVTLLQNTRDVFAAERRKHLDPRKGR